MDELDTTKAPYHLFDKKNLYGGVPPMELVVYYFDQEQYSDQDKYPWYPIYDAERNEYNLVDKAELDDPEYIQTLNYHRKLANLPLHSEKPNWPKRQSDDSIQYEHEDYEDYESEYDDEYFEESRNEFQRYIDLVEYDDCATSNDYYSDPLDSLKALCQTPFSSANIIDFINQTTHAALAEKEIPMSERRKTEDSIAHMAAQAIIKGKDKIRPVDENLVPYAKLVYESLNDKFPISNLVALMQTVDNNGGNLKSRIRSDKSLDQILKLAPGNVILEAVNLADHVKYYFKDDPTLVKVCNYITTKQLSVAQTLEDILNQKFLENIDPGYSPTSPSDTNVLIENDPLGGYDLANGILSSHDKLSKLYVLSISYLLSHDASIKFSDLVNHKVITVLRLNRGSDKYKSFRKKYGYIFLQNSFYDSIISSCKNVFKWFK